MVALIIELEHVMSAKFFFIKFAQIKYRLGRKGKCGHAEQEHPPSFLGPHATHCQTL